MKIGVLLTFLEATIKSLTLHTNNSECIVLNLCCEQFVNRYTFSEHYEEISKGKIISSIFE